MIYICHFCWYLKVSGEAGQSKTWIRCLPMAWHGQLDNAQILEIFFLYKFNKSKVFSWAGSYTWETVYTPPQLSIEGNCGSYLSTYNIIWSVTSVFTAGIFRISEKREEGKMHFRRSICGWLRLRYFLSFHSNCCWWYWGSPTSLLDQKLFGEQVPMTPAMGLNNKQMLHKYFYRIRRW